MKMSWPVLALWFFYSERNTDVAGVQYRGLKCEQHGLVLWMTRDSSCRKCLSRKSKGELLHKHLFYSSWELWS